MTTATVSPTLVADLTADELNAGSAVTLLQRVLLPRPSDPRKVRSLYVDEARSQRVRVTSRSAALLSAGDEVSFATYFNAFPASYWRRWTSLKTVTLRLSLSGACRLDVYRSKANGDIIHAMGATVSGRDRVVELDLDLTPFVDGGWYWFDITAEQEVEIDGAGWYADREPPRPGRLAVGICTYNRPVDCLEAVATIAADPVVSGELAAVVVADQGTRKVADSPRYAELSALLGDRLRLVEQGNLGGSGGFARSMQESLEHTDATHVLFLDDDVQLEADSLHRALSFSRFTDEPLLVGGQMLAIQDRSVLHTMGEVVDRYAFLYRPAAHAVMHHDFAKQSLREAAPLHRRVDVDYNAWWMCLIPREVPERVGLPLPLFIKWDDGEYGLRAGAAGFRTVTLPGAAIWHLAWTDKDDVTDWQAYFFARNRLIVAALHSPYKRGGGIVRSSIKADLRHLFKLEYSAVALHIKAYQDFLEGPSAVFPALPTALGDVRARQATYSDGRVITERTDMPDPQWGAVVTEGMSRPPVGKPSILRAALRALRNNMRPAGAEQDRPQLEIPAQDAQWFILSRLDSAAVGTADGRGVTLRRRNPAVFWQLAKQSVQLNIAIARRFPGATADYRGAYGELTAAENWEKAFRA